MPGPILTDAARDIFAAEIAAAVGKTLTEDVELDDLTRTITQTIDGLQSKNVLAVKLEDDDGNERTFPIQDLPVGVIDEIARKHDVGWLMVTDYPLQHTRLSIATDLLRAAAKQLKINAPRGLTPRAVIDAFVTVPDDVHREEGTGDGPLPISDGDED